MRGADHLAVNAFTKACDPQSRNGDAMFREILDRLDGPVMRNLKVESDATLTIRIMDRDVQLQMLREARQAAGPALEAELRRRALQGAVLEAEVIDNETSGSRAGDASPDEGESV